MFSQCTALITVVLPKGLKKIHMHSFFNTDIVSITIPKSVQMIGESAFTNSTRLSEITFEQGSELKRIGPNAFESC